MGNSPSCCIHRWSIAHFSWYLPKGRLVWKKCIESRVFKPENSELAFFMRLCPHNNNDYASLELWLKSGQVKNVNLNLTFEIEDGNGEKCFKETVEHNFNQNAKFVCNQYIRLAQLKRNEKSLLPNDTLTICCSIQDINSNVFQGSAVNFTHTESSLLSHIWTIDDFNDYLKGGKMSWKNILFSKTFTTSDGNVQFYLSLYPNGNEDRDHFSVYLHTKNKSDVKFNYSLSIVSASESKRNSVFKTRILTEGWGFQKLISHAELLNPANNYLSQNKLTIRVDIVDILNELIHGYTESSSCTKINALSHIWEIEDFSDYLNGGKMSWKEVLHSQEFSKSNTTFYLSLYPKGQTGESEEHLSVYLCLKEQCETKFNFSFSLIDVNNGTKHINKCAIMNSQLLTSGRGYEKYISHVDLLNAANNYLSNNKLTICVDIEDVGNEEIRGYTQSSSCTSINVLSHIWTIENFSDYLNGGKMSWSNGLNSKPFSTQDENFKFYLSLNLNEYGDEIGQFRSFCVFSDAKDGSMDYVSIFLHDWIGQLVHNKKFNFVFSIIDANGKRRNIQSIDQCDLEPKINVKPCFIDFSDNLPRGYQYISHVNLLNPQNNYLPDNKLTICVDIEDFDCEVIRGFSQSHSITKSNYLVHIWTIENFQSLGTGWPWKLGLKSYIDSDTFSTANEKAKFHLRLCPKGKFIGLFLHLVSCDQKEIVFNCSFAIFGNKWNIILGFCRKLSENSSFGYSSSIFKESLFNIKNGYLQNDRLTIYCGLHEDFLNLKNGDIINGVPRNNGRFEIPEGYSSGFYRLDECIRGYTETRSITKA